MIRGVFTKNGVPEGRDMGEPTPVQQQEYFYKKELEEGGLRIDEAVIPTGKDGTSNPMINRKPAYGTNVIRKPKNWRPDRGVT